MKIGATFFSEQEFYNKSDVTNFRKQHYNYSINNIQIV